MPDGAQIDFAECIGVVALRLCGEPNWKQSTADQLRFGTNASLSVEIGGPNRGTWYDHETKSGGGVLDLIRHKLGLVNGAALEWFEREINGRTEPQRAPQKRIVAAYDYEDEDGNLLFQAVRYEPKMFKQRRPDDRGGWIWNLNNVRLVPYRLPSFVGGTDTVYIAEGEKDVDALRRLGFVATCNPMGAGKWPEHFAEYFTGLNVVVLPDNDDAGRKHAALVACSLAPVAARVRIVELPGLPPKGDVSDWISAGGTPTQLCALTAAAEPFDPATAHVPWIEAHVGDTDNRTNHANQQRAVAGFATTCVDTIMAMKFEPLRWTVPGYVPEGLSILAGRQKLGKTWLAIDFAIAVAIGGLAMGSIQCEQGDVLYIDLENGQRRFQRRIATLFPYEESRPAMNRLQWAGKSPELGPDFIAACESWRTSVGKPALIVVDVLQRIKPAGRASRNSYENDYAVLADLQRWATESGVSVLVLHHTRKGGADDPLEALSGSNGLSACADTTLVLDRTAFGITLYVRGRDVDEKETALAFDGGRWSILGDAASVRRSDTRSKILSMLIDATEPMSPKDLAVAAEIERNNADQLLFKMAKAGEVLKAGRGRYVHPERSDLLDIRKKDKNVRNREDEDDA